MQLSQFRKSIANASNAPRPTGGQFPASDNLKPRLQPQSGYTATLGPLFSSDAMLAARRRNRYSWFSPRANKNPDMDNEQATFWLGQFIGKNLRIHASDGRVFGGQMKCTDKDRNIILALAYEYRAPSAEAIRKAVEESGNQSATVAWNSRYVGLIVVPGQHIKKIEFEETLNFQLYSSIVMKVRDHSRIVIKSLDSIQPTTFPSDAERYEVKEAARRLLSRLENPFEQSWRLSVETPVLIAGVQTALDLGIWEKWTEADKAKPGAAVNLEQLVKWANKEVEPNLLRRLFRHLAALNVLEETDVDTWKPTPYTLSVGDTESGIPIITQCGIDHTIPAPLNLPSFLKKHNYREPVDPKSFDNYSDMNGGTDLHTLCTADPEGKGRSYMGIMQALENHKMPWTDIYDTQEIIDGADMAPGKPLLVKISNAHSRDATRLLEENPDLPEGVLIVQGPPEVIDNDAESTDPRIVKQAYDYLAPQPQLHARAYLIHAVLYEKQDAECVRLLSNIKAAFKPGYSKLLIYEIVLPEKGAASLTTTVDLQVMSCRSKRVRTEEQWGKLLAEAGFKIVHLRSHPRAVESIIEADLA
ncbi:hypothetical protein yc1106_00045 [Curvularia clavata]|uniref:O-methyltransferase C-terminal domain-containing protein n=1 Tax=Curvularia clavata TaxID=95742 RepID=A0A9Q9DNZ0_CURCL|nr:hypothetical protein yc1106_00045 [Curvularia clavata]